MMIKAPALKTNGKIIPIKLVKKPEILEMAAQLDDAREYIEELREIADDFRKERDKLKEQKEHWKAEALKFEVDTRIYKQQAKIYAEEKQQAELMNIRAARIINEAQGRLLENKYEDAAELLTTGKEINLFI